MAVTASGLFGLSLEHCLINTAAIDWQLETNKGTVFTDTVGPDFDTDTAYGAAPYDANEADGGSWPSGGIVLVGTEITLAGGTMKFDATDVSQVTTDITTDGTVGPITTIMDSGAGVYEIPESLGSRFDLGMAWALRKPLKLVRHVAPTPHKSMENVILYWQKNGPYLPKERNNAR